MTLSGALNSADVPSDRWPPEFYSLKRVVVGELEDFYRSYNNAFHLSSKVVAPSFLLPSLEILTSTCITDEHENRDSDRYLFEWGPEVSSVKELTFDIDQMHPGVLISFVKACRNPRKFKCPKEIQARFEPDIFDALNQHRATLDALEFF